MAKFRVMRDEGFGPISLTLAFYNAYQKHIQYKADAGEGDYSLYIPMALLPNGSCPEYIDVTFETPARNPWPQYSS